MPKTVVFRNNTVTVMDAARGLYLVKWLATGYTPETFPQTIETPTVFDCDNSPVRYVDPTSGADLSHLDGDGHPKTTVFLNKPYNTVGAPWMRVRRQPSLNIILLAATNAVNKTARWTVHAHDIAGNVRVQQTPGAYGDVLVECLGSLTNERHSNGSGYAEQGDERVLKIGEPRRTTFINDGIAAGFLTARAAPERVATGWGVRG